MKTSFINRFVRRAVSKNILISLVVILLTACGGGATPPAQLATLPVQASPTSGQPEVTPTTAATESIVPTEAVTETLAATSEATAVLPLTGVGPTVAVEINDPTFNPKEVTIPVGTTVVWTNTGQFPHTVTADDGSFTSGTLQPEGVYEHTFDQVGAFKYYCEFHGGPGGQGMSAVITVVAAEQPTAATATQTSTQNATAAPTLPPTGGSTDSSLTVVSVLNRDTTQAAKSPALAVGTITAGAPPNLWATWAENSPGNVRQIFASELAAGSFQPRGASLNIHVNVLGDFPSITFAGENRLVPWVAWAEPSPGFDNVSQIFASRFNSASGLWQQAGQDRGGGEASLNLHTNRNASRPFIFGGSGDSTQPPVPWVAWEELSSLSSFSQIFVARGAKDDTGIGGFVWQTVGQITNNGEPSLNISHFRQGLHPTGVFAETGNAVPWVTWHESGGDQPERVFTARGVADANTPGGFRWITVPPCAANDETSCALNINPLKAAKDASTAAGTLTPGEAAVPWIAWAEIGPTGKWQILVSRLDLTTRNSFLAVGGSLNVDQNHDARAPYITFVKNVPYVAYLEDNGSGKFSLHIRHLDSNQQNVSWVLDTPPAGFSANTALSATDLFAVGSDDALYLAWTESDVTGAAAQVVTGVLTP